MTLQIDPAFKAAYRETQGQPVDAVGRPTTGFLATLSDEQQKQALAYDGPDSPIGHSIVAAQQDGRLDLIERELRERAEYRAKTEGPFTKENLVEWRAATALAEKDARIAELERLTDAIDEERRGALDLCLERNKELLASRAECEGLRAALEAAANQCDRWADESRNGGWSTHQVDANRKLADTLRSAALSQKEMGDAN